MEVQLNAILIDIQKTKDANRNILRQTQYHCHLRLLTHRQLTYMSTSTLKASLLDHETMKKYYIVE